MSFTQEKLEQILGHKNGTDKWFSTLSGLFPSYDITTNERMGAFISQCAHESGKFLTLKENLNYSAEGLVKVFGKYFPTLDDAKLYSRQPEKIANKVYANRMGNGPESSGDGFKYRGRGLIQVTGKENYTRCSQDLFGDTRLVDDPEFLTTIEGASLSALWFWKKNNLNKYADSSDIRTLTIKINGGLNGIDDRQRLYQIALAHLIK